MGEHMDAHNEIFSLWELGFVACSENELADRAMVPCAWDTHDTLESWDALVRTRQTTRKRFERFPGGPIFFYLVILTHVSLVRSFIAVESISNNVHVFRTIHRAAPPTILATVIRMAGT